jgi:hypothetical protein
VTVYSYEPYKKSDGTTLSYDDIVKSQAADIQKSPNRKDNTLIQAIKNKEGTPNPTYGEQWEFTSDEGKKIIFNNNYLFMQDKFYVISETAEASSSPEDKQLISDTVSTFRTLVTK